MPAPDIVDDLAEWQMIVKFDWVVSRAWNTLHHVQLSDGQWAQWEPGDWLTGPVRLSCGRTAAGICVPGVITRMGAPRCTGCCRAVGYPPGKGSPKNSADCRAILGLPESGLGIGSATLN